MPKLNSGDVLDKLVTSCIRTFQCYLLTGPNSKINYFFLLLLIKSIYSCAWMKLRKQNVRCWKCNCSRNSSCLMHTRVKSRCRLRPSTIVNARSWSRESHYAEPCWNKRYNVILSLTIWATPQLQNMHLIFSEVKFIKPVI